jgi:hypothetical protein
MLSTGQSLDTAEVFADTKLGLAIAGGNASYIESFHKNYSLRVLSVCGLNGVA